jgi:hypothetical protein
LVASKRHYGIEKVPVIFGGFSFGGTLSQTIALYLLSDKLPVTVSNISIEILDIVSLGTDHIFIKPDRDLFVSSYSGRYISLGLGLINIDNEIEDLDRHLQTPEHKGLKSKFKKVHINSMVLLTSFGHNEGVVGILPLSEVFSRCRIPCRKHHPMITHRYDFYRKIIADIK